MFTIPTLTCVDTRNFIVPPLGFFSLLVFSASKFVVSQSSSLSPSNPFSYSVPYFRFPSFEILSYFDHNPPYTFEYFSYTTTYFLPVSKRREEDSSPP